MGDFSWGYYSGLIRVVAQLVCTCTWLLSVLLGSLLNNNLNSHSLSQGLVHCLQKRRSHPLWDFLCPEPEDIGRQRENILLLQGPWPSDLAVTGCGIWPPAYQDSMFCWVIVKEVESPSSVPFLEPLPQKRPPNMTPRLPTDALPHHICTHGHTSAQPVLAHSFQPVLAVASALPSKSWPG
jgi:hypothetical protein